MTKHQLKQDLEANNPKGECCLKCKGNKKNLWQCKNSACSCHIKLCHQSPDKCEHMNLKRDSKNCPDCGEEMINLDEIISDNSIRELLIEREKLIHIRKHISIMDEF